MWEKAWPPRAYPPQPSRNICGSAQIIITKTEEKILPLLPLRQLTQPPPLEAKFETEADTREETKKSE